jgi:REP element-mobilizing transposase RayT
MARLFLDVLLNYRSQHKYLLHEFVLMPDHFHLLLTPLSTIERALQLIKAAIHSAPGRNWAFEERCGRRVFMTAESATGRNIAHSAGTFIGIR